MIQERERTMVRLEEYAPTLLRVVAGIIFFAHGFSKFQNPAGFIGFVGQLGFPASAIFGWIVILLETVGGLLLILGFGTRWVSLALAVEMLITTLLVKSSIGLIAPQGQPGVGAELDLMLLATALALAILGSGQLSIDRNILGRERV